MKVVLAYPGVWGRRRDGKRIEGVVPQFDGSPYAAGNCGAASESHRDQAQQQGRRPAAGSPWPPTGASIRARTGDKSGGLMPSQTQKVTRDVYRMPALPPRVAPWSDLLDLAWAGFTIDLLLDYGPVDDVRSGSPGFRGSHRSPIVGIRRLDSGAVQLLWADTLYCGRRAGIPEGPVWIDHNVLLRAAGLLEIVPGVTVNERYGRGKAYFIPSGTRYDPTPPPATKPILTPDAAPTKEQNAMIASTDIGTRRVMKLAKDQPVFRYPGGPRVTRMSREGDVGYVGHAGGNWGAVVVTTARPYADGKPRPTICYVPLAAGPIRDRS